MALFSFRHSAKTFSTKRTNEARAAKLGQTASHLRYITRPKAARVVIEERLSRDTHFETASIAEEEAQQRKGRVCERFVIALPIEATSAQREALTCAFANRLSKGVAGYVAAIHDMNGNDIANPHAHFVFFDVQQKTSGRGRPKSTLGFARKNAIENAAKMWADLHNEMMRAWGYGPASEITHLSFAERGIERIPTIHEGASARVSASAPRISKTQWHNIDQGHSRAEANTIIREINQLKEDQENAGSVRLARNDGNDSAQRCSSIPEQRAYPRRNVEVAERSRPPFAQNLKPDYRGREGRGRSCPADIGVQSSTEARPGRQSGFPSIARLGLSRGIRRRRGVRRIYRELIMLRDTLRARLLLMNEQSRSHQVASHTHIEEDARPRNHGRNKDGAPQIE